jgi:sulfotransferase family protein
MTASAEQSISAVLPQQRIPDFFIVGHAKCGTTALYEMLRRHPQIYMPDYKSGAGKEPWFFSRDNPNPQTSGERDIAFTGRTAMSMEEYLSLFDGAQAERLLGEASTSYLWSRSAAERIAAARPDARIVAIIREPASFLRSLHLQLLENHHETERDFRTAVELDQPRRENRHIPIDSYWPQALIYSDRVKYVEQLQRYRAAFSPEQMLVLIYDDFRDDNEATVRRVLRFLDADDTLPLAAIHANPTVSLRSGRAESVKQALRSGQAPPWRAARTLGKALTSARLRKRVYYPLQRRAIYTAPPPPDGSFMLELRRRFKAEVVALSEYLDRDLVALWGYDALG